MSGRRTAALSHSGPIAEAEIEEGRQRRVLSNWGGAVERAKLPGLRLGPFAAADYDFAALQRSGVIPPGVREVVLEVESFAAPGSVRGRAFSVSTDLSYGLYSVLESDGTGFWSGIYWSLKGDENTVMTIANIGDEETTAAVELAYPGGVARLRPLPVRPRETVTLNLRRDLPRLLADGGRLPPGAESGGYRVRSVEDPLRAELVVKQHVLSASKRTAAPFYGQCAYVTGLWLGGATWPTIDVLVGGKKVIEPFCNLSTGGFVGDFGAVIQPDGGNQISIGPQYGYSRTITGLAPGLRDILHSSSVPTASNPCGTEILMGAPPPAEVPAPSLSCPTSITRGQSVNVSISGTGTASIVWSFLDQGSPTATKSGGTTWNGVMVKSGTIRATVTPQGGEPHIVECFITVNNRTNFAFQPVAAERKTTAVSCGSDSLDLPSPPSASGDAVGKFCLRSMPQT